jgi:2Fe-2S ferredoxin
MKIKFMPQNVECEIKPNESVLKVAQDNGIHIKSVCKGVPSCSECVVKIVGGEYNVFKPTPSEINLIGSAYFVDQRRLSCQLKCFGDVTIDLTDQIEKANRIVTKKPRGRQIQTGDDFDPGASKAVRGSILFEGGDPMNIPEDDDIIEEKPEAKPKHQPQNANQNHHRPNKPTGKPNIK